MLNLDASSVATGLPYDQLINALDESFAVDFEVPQRAHLDVDVPDGAPGNLLLMPAWQAGAGMGVKIATVFPDNAKQSLPAVFASYILMSAKTGIPLAVLDGSELTLRRTAAASALASKYLSRKDASSLLMAGTGNLAPYLIEAHTCARPIDNVTIWGRRADAAERLAEKLGNLSICVSVTSDLEEAVRHADIVSCATLASEPFIKGEWLQKGQHLDLVGAFRPDMSEADVESLRRATVFVDTRSGALAEAGEIIQAIEQGALSSEDIAGELRDLAKGLLPGRRDDEQITLFKSVGTALEDLCAAELAVRNSSAEC